MIDDNKFFEMFLIVVGLILLLVPMDTPPMQEEDDEWLHDYPDESEEDRILGTAAEQEEMIVEEATVIAIRGIDYGGKRSGMPCELPRDRALDMEKQPEPLPDPADIISLADIPEETAAPENLIQAYDQTASVPVDAAEPAPAAEEEIAEGSYERETSEEEAPEGDGQGYEEGAADPADAEERRVDDDGLEGDEGYSEGEQGAGDPEPDHRQRKDGNR